MPPESNTQNSRREAVSQTSVYIAASLFLIAVASFFAVYSYLDNAKAAAATQTAGVAAAIDPFEGLDITADAAIVIDLQTGKTLYERNADAQLPLASITKVPLALVVADNLPLETTITIPYDTAPLGAKERLGQGEKWSVRDVINFTLVTSSNEGADILARAADSAIRSRYPLAPAGGAALWRMNALAGEIGLAHSYFLNVSGLDESETQSGAYGSARDVAKIFSYAYTHDSGVLSGTARGGLLLTGEDGNTTSAVNTNEALGEIPGLIMGKTGFTDLAGGNLAVLFDVGLAHPVVAVVMHSTREERFTDMKALVAAARTSVMQQ